MLSADFAERYQLVRQVTEGAVRTFHAVAQTGAVVMVHIVEPGARDEHWHILGLMDRLEPNAKERIVEVGEVDGGPVVVTRFLPEFDSLSQWLEAHGRDPRPGEQANDEPPGSTPPTSPPGEFTQLFRSPLLEENPGEARPDPPAPAEIPRAEPGCTEQPGPGEFTRWFARQTGPPPEEAAADEPGLSYRTRDTRGESGEPAPVDWRSRLASDSSPGDASPPAGVQGFRIAHDPNALGGAAQPPPQTPVPTGPGEYTRVLSSGQAAPVYSAPSPAAPPPPVTRPPQGPSRALLIWGLAGIVFAAVVTVVLFALLAREATPPAEPTAGEAQEAPANTPPAEPEADSSEPGAGG